MMGWPGEDQISEIEFLWRLQQITDRYWMAAYEPAETPDEIIKKLETQNAILEEQHELEGKYPHPLALQSDSGVRIWHPKADT